MHEYVQLVEVVIVPIDDDHHHLMGEEGDGIPR